MQISRRHFFDGSLLTGNDFTNANLANASIFANTVKGNNFTAADLRGVLLFASLDSTNVTRNMIWPDGSLLD